MSHEDSAIPLPWVLGLEKLYWKGRGKQVRLQQRLSMIWWLTYAIKSEKRRKGTVVKLAMIKKGSWNYLRTIITQRPCSLSRLRQKETIMATHAVDAF